MFGGFHIAADQVELGVVQFSSSADTVIGLSSDASAIKSAISTLPQMRGNTNTGAGFSQAKSILDTQGRPNTAGKLAIIITDGRQNMGTPAEDISDALQKEGVAVFGVGVGNQIDPAEIQRWCSKPLDSHYFSVSDFSHLETILQKIIKDACKPHPPPLPEFLQAAARLRNGKNCFFHLPANLPTLAAKPSAHRQLSDASSMAKTEVISTTQLELPTIVSEISTSAWDMEVTPWEIQAGASNDTCNQFKTCNQCIHAASAGGTCGWCTGDLKYDGSTSPSPFKCAGASNTGASGLPKFTCTGHFQTSSCEEPASCGLEGVYRGIRIDNRYDFGEWSMDVTGKNSSEQVKITSLDITGKASSTIEGKLQCGKPCSQGSQDAGVPFTLTTTTGSIRHGICGYTDQNQAETSGLMCALPDVLMHATEL